MSSRTVFLVMGLILVVGLIVLAIWGGRERPEPSKPQPPQARSPERLLLQPVRKPAAPPPRPIPQAQITVDGEAGDWADVPAVLKPFHGRRDRTKYRCQAVKLARDAENLYVLFVLDLGIGERFDNQMKADSRPSTGALGYLTLQTEGHKFNICIPTGYQQRIDRKTSKSAWRPIAEFTVARHVPAKDEYEEVFRAGALKQPQFTAFAGKHLELKMPLARLGITAAQPVKAELDEF